MAGDCLHSGITQQLLVIDGYNAGHPGGPDGTKDGNGDNVEELSMEYTQQDVMQCESRAKEEVESETEDKRDACVNHEFREQRLEVLCASTVCALVVG